MALILTFNILDSSKKTAIRLTALRFGIPVREIPPEAQSLSIEELLRTDAYPPAGAVPADAFTDELLLLHALPQASFHALLDTLRREGQSVRLKAVVTDHNRSWTPVRLHRELLAEEKAMAELRRSRHGEKKR